MHWYNTQPNGFGLTNVEDPDLFFTDTDLVYLDKKKPFVERQYKKFLWFL